MSMSKCILNVFHSRHVDKKSSQTPPAILCDKSGNGFSTAASILPDLLAVILSTLSFQGCWPNEERKSFVYVLWFWRQQPTSSLILIGWRADFSEPPGQHLRCNSCANERILNWLTPHVEPAASLLEREVFAKELRMNAARGDHQYA